MVFCFVGFHCWFSFGGRMPSVQFYQWFWTSLAILATKYYFLLLQPFVLL
jgi:hypothetical protein